MAAQPLISCIMPTYNRRPFIPHAVEYFLRQDYPNRELIVVDDGIDPVGDLLPDSDNIRYIRLDKRITLGAKLNLACEHAKGELIAHWDDDDWYAPHRLAYQMDTLAKDKTQICGINQLLYLDLRSGLAFEYRYPPKSRVWLLGSELCYNKSFWHSHRFADINVGMDGQFVFSAPPNSVSVLKEHSFAVHMIHHHNVSPKKTQGGYWHPHPVEAIEKILGQDWCYYQSAGHWSGLPLPRQLQPTSPQLVEIQKPVLPLRNINACLVHENPDCVIDLVRNLRHLDPESRILLYDGSPDGKLLDKRLPWTRWGVEICPQPRPMKWGQLHGFALDCLRYLKNTGPFDTLTVVDSDQLALKSGYSSFLAQHLNRSKLGLLSNSPDRLGPNTRIPPAVTAQQEIKLWRPFLKRFEGGEEKFVHWTFWPATVITAEAGLAMLDLFEHDRELARILVVSRLWATEEILFPTLVALLGFRVERNPCLSDYVQYRKTYAPRELELALGKPDAFWIHPVPRRLDDPLRSRIRQFHNDYRSPSQTHGQPHTAQLWPLLNILRNIEGWLADEEAELLAIATREAINRSNGNPCIVEIGSHCGKATFLMASLLKSSGAQTQLVAVDSFDGVVGSKDHGLLQCGPTLDKFNHLLKTHGLEPWVETHVSQVTELAWEQPVDLLLIDGLHDYASVVADFIAFERCLKPGSCVAFHDYADYFPGVCAFVDELLASQQWQEVAQSGTLKIIQYRPPSEH